MMTKSKIIACATFLVMLIAFSSCSNVKVETGDNFEVIELPDGSMVYLNHNSLLEYDQEFDSREIDIEGEFYFSITKDDKPFVVNTELGQITVLGTEFSVKSDKNNISVEVEEGSVELNTKQNKNKVAPGERAFYEKGGKKIQKGKAEFDFNIWMIKLKIEFKKLGKELKRASKELDKESKKLGKEIKRSSKELDKDSKKVGGELKKEFKKLKIK